MATVCVDYPDGAVAAPMVVGGMTVLERVLREAARAGADRAVVRADAAELPALPDAERLGLTVEVVAPDRAVDGDARTVAGDVVAGVRITDRASRRRAARALLQSCRRPYDGVGDRHVIRPVSLRLTSVLARVGVTPNQVTLANVVVGLAACAAAAWGTWPAFALAGALMFVQVVLDSSDGELARIRHLHSRFGMVLDNMSDDVIDNLFVIALGIGLGGPWQWIALAAGLARGAVAVMIYVAVARAGQFGDVMAFRWWFDAPDDDLAERFEPRLTPLSLVRGLGRRDLYVLVWTASCVAGLPVIGLGLGLAVAGSYVVLAIGHALATRRRG